MKHTVEGDNPDHRSEVRATVVSHAHAALRHGGICSLLRESVNLPAKRKQIPYHQHHKQQAQR